MDTHTISFGLYRLLDQHFDTVIEQLHTALQAAGFELLAEIDLTKILEKRTQSHVKRHRVFVVCHPELAVTALTLAPKAGTLLLCEIDVYHLDDHQVEVTVMSPLTQYGTVLESHLKPIGEQLSLRLEYVIDALKG